MYPLDPTHQYLPTKYNPNGYENCEFFMGPAGEAGHAKVEREYM
jgi:hypothetical protein